MLGPGYQNYGMYSHKLRKFLFEHNYPEWFSDELTGAHSTQDAENFIMQLHTGKSVTEPSNYYPVPDETLQRQGQEILLKLAQDLLKYWKEGLDGKGLMKVGPAVSALQSGLELDGYLFRNGQLLAPEEEVLDTEETAGVLEALYGSLGLEMGNIALNHLSMSEQHYQAGRWTDCITNSRNFLEAVLREVAAKHSKVVKNQPLSDDTYKRPVRVREYLRDEKLIDEDEMQALAKVYGLLSGKGSHPYMAENDQARLLRNLALLLSQFVMLRFDSLLNGRNHKNTGYRGAVNDTSN
ncbi:MAG TPA: hypothetical protein VJ183_20695 [Chloroflexia bacterium]|nr:hypothetical protein [Chloroflexia bacterium]